MTPGLLARLPEAVATHLQAAFPDLKECAAHEARLTLEEVKGLRIKAPAIRVVMLGLRPDKDAAGPAAYYLASMVTYVVTTDQRGLDKDTACLNIAEGVIRQIKGQRWDEADVNTPRDIAMQALSDSATRQKGVAIRAVLWNQPVLLSDAPVEDYPYPSEIYLGFDPKIGAAHEGDYVQITGEDGS